MNRLLPITVALLALLADAALAAGPSPGTAAALTFGPSRFAAAVGAGATTLTAGSRSQRIPGAWGFPRVTFGGAVEGLSHDGSTLVLAARTQGAVASPSRFALVDPASLRLRRTVSLPGRFAYDALSPDARRLYLVEFVSVVGELRYRVRSYDLASGRLERRVIADKRSGWTTMQGMPFARATSADGSWVYTLYGGGGAAKTFVHALNARAGYAVCIDLPRVSAVDGMRLRLRGPRLAVVAPGGGEAAAIDTASLDVLAAR
jgi:hypothetical protein